MSGLMGGSWKRGSPAGHPRVPGRCAEKRHHDGLVGTQPADNLQPRQLPTRLRHGNSSACFDAIEYFVTERLVLFISNKHQKRGRWFGRRVLFGSPTRLGLVRLAGTVSAPRPNRWR
ncbi:MAG TPA: hypothetical protein VK988_05955 [Acidimicrobiales bacterium]|nr:hypothetical protein [Acidimicrobiales bacterium]